LLEVGGTRVTTVIISFNSSSFLFFSASVGSGVGVPFGRTFCPLGEGVRRRRILSTPGVKNSTAFVQPVEKETIVTKK
jgi:hypothetical protein